MKQLYKQVRVDEKEMRFYAECPSCSRRKDAGRLPLLCRNREMLTLFAQGKSSRLRQKAYDKRKTAAVQYLARFFNLCLSCGKWVCDDCYDSDSDRGVCRNCSARDRK